jgi:signal transduction histidine kinase
MADTLAGLPAVTDSLLAQARETATRVRALPPLDELSQLLERLADEREHAERALVRLGLDLHDGPLQEIAAVTMELHFFRDQLTGALGADAHVVRTVDGLIGRVDSLATDMRELAGGSYGSISPRPLLTESLASMTDLYADMFEVDLIFEPRARIANALPLNAVQQTAIVRIVQTALANIAQHSGAYQVKVAVRVWAEQVEVEVWDDGAGFDVETALRRAEATGHLGLVGMRHRAQLAGGLLDVASAPGGPTCVRLLIPVGATATD